MLGFRGEQNLALQHEIVDTGIHSATRKSKVKGELLRKQTVVSLFSLILLCLVSQNANAQLRSNAFERASIDSGEVLASPLAVVGGFDLNNNGWGEFIVLSDQPDHQLKIFEATGDNRYALRSSTSTGTSHYRSGGLDVGNLDDDPELEIVVAHQDGLVFDVDPSTLTPIPHPAHVLPSVTSPDAVKILREGKSPHYFIVCNSDSLVAYIWNGAGWSISDKIDNISTPNDMAIGDTDGDGLKEIVVVSENTARELLAITSFSDGKFAADGTILNNSLPKDDSGPYPRVAVGDLDRNGTDEIAVSWFSEYIGGVVLYNYRSGFYDRDAYEVVDLDEPQVRTIPVGIHDFDHDGRGEIYFAEGEEHLSCVEFNGRDGKGKFETPDFDARVRILGEIPKGFAFASQILNRTLDGDRFTDIPVLAENLLYVLEAVPFNISVAVDSANQVVPPGGATFPYNLQIENNVNGTKALDFWAKLIRPDGSVVDPAFGPKSFALDSLEVLIQSPPITVRPNDDPGNYTLVAFIGSYPGDTLDSDTTGFTKLGVEKAEGPQKSVLLHNSPNPFNPSTTIRYELSQTSRVSLRVYNMLGQEVATLVDGFEEPGAKSVIWEGTSQSGDPLPSGVYFSVLRVGDLVATDKMLLLK